MANLTKSGRRAGRPKSEQLTKAQETNFKYLFARLLGWVEDRKPTDYYPGRPEDGHFAGDVRSQRIEFIVGTVTYDVILTCRRNDLD
jgi:hypothetical protein